MAVSGYFIWWSLFSDLGGLAVFRADIGGNRVMESVGTSGIRFRGIPVWNTASTFLRLSVGNRWDMDRTGRNEPEKGCFPGGSGWIRRPERSSWYPNDPKITDKPT
ncbi:unnamed protein product [Adineta ricciae]|uniref:Uncharacterized protein n=1 Tax=Adineta ricciae TaxID=249248 RepID=A0A815TVR5_ADIRI|nr:unnamed protein product [Adineta ricciae]CAF1510175.1 unnamed protein product [Adineta ricciae]